MIVSPEPATSVVAADYQTASEKASDGEEPFHEPLVGCSELLGGRSTRLLDGRNAPAAEGHVEGDDSTGSTASSQDSFA
jgi:hypothetical protein